MPEIDVTWIDEPDLTAPYCAPVHNPEKVGSERRGLVAAPHSPREDRAQSVPGRHCVRNRRALIEELSCDRADGQPVNADLAGYLVPVHADVPESDDLNFNSMGCRGVGEIGITGVAAAIANAAYHATGVRVRDLPLTSDKLLRRA